MNDDRFYEPTMKVNPMTAELPVHRPFVARPGSDRARVRQMARDYELRLVAQNEMADTYAPTHTDKLTFTVMFSRPAGSTRHEVLNQATRRDTRRKTQEVSTDSIWTIGTWFDREDIISVQLDVIFNFAGADGNGLRLERVSDPAMGFEAFYMRVMDSKGGTMAACELDETQLEVLLEAMENEFGGADV